jgi:hypothetical protein
VAAECLAGPVTGIPIARDFPALYVFSSAPISPTTPLGSVAEGSLRKDLYCRLQVNVLAVPPHRERREDLSLLVEHFIALLNEKRSFLAPMPLSPVKVEVGRPYYQVTSAIEPLVPFEALPELGNADTGSNSLREWS